MSSKSELTRQRLLDGAMASFADHGFHGTSTRHIAAAAGMSPAAVYVHYSSKEELLYEISRKGHRELLEIVQAAVALDADATTRLRTLVRDFIVYHAQNHASSRVVNYEFTRLEPDHLTEIVEMRVGIDVAITAVLDAGVEEGAFTIGDIPMTTTAVASLAVDVSRWFRDGRSWSPQAVGDYFADLSLRMVGAA